MKKMVGKILSVCILASFCIAIAPDSVSEARHSGSRHGKNYDKRYDRRYDNRDNRRYDDRRDRDRRYESRYYRWPEHRRVIINTISLNDRHYDYAREHRFALNDLLVARAIADHNGYVDTEDVLRMMRRGHSQIWVADYYGVRWRDVERHTGDYYRDVKRNLVKAGVVLWTLDKVLD